VKRSPLVQAKKTYVDNAKNGGPYLMLLNRNHSTFQGGHIRKTDANVRNFMFRENCTAKEQIQKIHVLDTN